MDNLTRLAHLQKELVEYRRLVQLASSSDINLYDVVISRGSRICEEILLLICTEKGYGVDNLGRVDTEMGVVHVLQIFSRGGGAFQRIADDILPVECQKFLRIIRSHRNLAVHVHEGEVSHEMTMEFAHAMDYFLIWFQKEYCHDGTLGKIKGRFFSLQDTLSFPEVSLVDQGKIVPQNLLLQKLAEQSDLLLRLSSQLSSIDERGQRIEIAVGEIQQSLKEISQQVSAFQSLVEKQINLAGSESEIDRILQAFTEECTSRIVTSVKENNESKVFELEKRKLIASLGEDAWNKLDDSSKTFLISSKVMYNNMILLDNCLDYSGVCLLVTKALEVEMSRRFCSGYLEYLNKTYHKDYHNYPTPLLGTYQRPLPLDKFTMGSFAFILCLYHDKKDTPGQIAKNKRILLDYASHCIFSNKSYSQIEAILLDYAQEIDSIRQMYRNPAAHTNMLKRHNAESCFNLVLDVEKLLKKMLDSFIS
jgi:hypothetical protein